jgi:hypothetical protein
MQRHAEPDGTMSADQRRREVARILAAGVLRLQARAALPPDPGETSGPKNRAQSGQDCLEVLRKTVLSVHTG